MSAEQEYFETPGHVIAASIVVPVIDILALAIRFHLRRKLKHGLKADDWLILLATVRNHQILNDYHMHRGLN